jgi:tripartite-type tricarboxylate transporter receptor subunit TctC
LASEILKALKGILMNARRLTLRSLLATLTLACFANLVHAKPKSIKILVGFPPGGVTDALARILADKLKDELGIVVVVDNKPGAGGQLAAQALKASPADGSVLFLSHDHTISILPQLVKNPGFDPHADFVPVAGFASFVNALAVSPNTPAKNFGEYLQWLKANGGKGAVGIPAPASTLEFLVKLVGEKYHLDLVSAPYRGSAPMMADMLGNQIAAGTASIPDFIEYHKAGKLRVIAVLGGRRQSALPDVPTFTELGLGGLEDQPYYGLFAPTGTPAAWIETVSQAMSRVLQQADVREQLTKLGLTVQHMSPAQLGQREKAYTAAWADIIERSGFKPQ